jgi:hypothetical protein
MGYDINASASTSSSATSGLDQGFGDFGGGDFIVGGSKSELPAWTWVALIGGALLFGIVWLMRR